MIDILPGIGVNEEKSNPARGGTLSGMPVGENMIFFVFKKVAEFV